MKTMKWSAVLLATVILAATSTYTYADFGSSIHYEVDPSGEGGFAWGSAWGDNAVITSLGSNVELVLNPDDGTGWIYASLGAEGMWGDPEEESPYYDFLEEFGLRTHSSLRLTDVFWNGEWYEFEDLVSFDLNGHGGLYRRDDPPSMTGFLNSYATGYHCIPTDAWVNITLYEPGHPDWLPDWQVYFGSSWLITSEYRLVPEPSTLALLGLGGLFRRRRHC